MKDFGRLTGGLVFEELAPGTQWRPAGRTVFESDLASYAQPLIDRIHAGAKSGLTRRHVQDAPRAQGVAPEGSAPEAARRFPRAEMEKHEQQVKRSGARME